ncbi:hypothetical protein [Streptomyces sp. MMG1121]|uniref:hypothetical protein n=1 Tax=Streptomyces sp. MMG1121 TaxID=1415544 RepID=UPI00131E8AED|nr:hypothetical protein [Streptomyces sp. MMG1121]
MPPTGPRTASARHAGQRHAAVGPQSDAKAKAKANIRAGVRVDTAGGVRVAGGP